MEHDRASVFSHVYQGIPIECDERDYPDVRRWLGECAAFHEDANTTEGGLRAFIARNEIKRLDEHFEVREREA